MNPINSEQEFWFAYAWIGGLVLAGILICIALVGLGIVVRRKIKEQQVIKKIYEQERNNGKHK